MSNYVVTKNSDIIPSETNGMSLVKVDEETQMKLNVAQKVFDALVDDGVYGEYVLGCDLWNEFKAVFTKAH